MILPEDSDCFVFDFDIIAEDEEQETGLEEAVVFNEQPSTSRGRGQTTGSSERGRGRGRGRGRLQSRQENSSRLPCNHPGCDKTYANKTTLRSHKKKHAWTDLKSKVPEGEALRTNISTAIQQSFTKIIDSIKIDDLGVVELAKKISTAIQDNSLFSLVNFLEKEFGEVTCNLSATLKTGVRTQFLMGTNKLVNNTSFIEELGGIFVSILENPSKEALNLLCGVFMLNFSQELLLLIVRAMLGSAPPAVAIIRKKWSSDDVDSEEFKEIIYYIGGSVVHSFHSALRRRPKAVNLTRFCHILKTRFEEPKDIFAQRDNSEIEPPELCDDTVKEWTKERNRGGLIFITKDAHNLFVALADFVLCCEAEDGSLEQDYVFEGVLKNSTILMYWDFLIGLELEEAQSIDFLQAVCQVFVKCARQGILKRRLHDAIRSAYTSVSLRHRLSR